MADPGGTLNTVKTAIPKFIVIIHVTKYEVCAFCVGVSKVPKYFCQDCSSHHVTTWNPFLNEDSSSSRGRSRDSLLRRRSFGSSHNCPFRSSSGDW